MEINNRRKEILLDIDNGINVSPSKLAMYGLTAYIRGEKIETGNRIMDFRLEGHVKDRKLKHDSSISLMPEQYSLLSQIDLYDKILFMAPTSFGKSLLIKEYIWNTRPSIVVYIVPTNALAYEIENSYKKTFKEVYNIFDSESEAKINNENMQMFIGTQEKFNKIRDTLQCIDLLIIDEAYKLNDSLDDERGLSLSKVLIEDALEKNAKLVLILPNATVKNINKYNFKILESKFNPVEKIFIETVSIVEQVNEQIEKEEKTIVYFDKPGEMKKLIKDVNGKNHIENKSLLDHLAKEYTKDFNVYKALEKGIVVHHGQMPKYLQNKMISMFNNSSNNNILFGTRSISEGINTPTKNLILYSSVDVEKDKMLVKNTIGRAGRLGEYPIGKIIASKEQLNELSHIDDNLVIEIKAMKTDDDKPIKKVERNKKINEYFIDTGLKYKRATIEEIEKSNMSLMRIKQLIDYMANDIESKDEFFKINKLYNLVNKLYSKGDKKLLWSSDMVILSCFLYPYKYIDGKKYYLNTFRNKLNYIKAKKKSDKEKNEKYKLSISKEKMIDSLFKHRYVTLEYQVMPIVNICLLICEDNNILHDREMYQIVQEVKRRYATYTLGRPNIDNLTDIQKEILVRLTEYGIPPRLISDEMLILISNKLKNRYSMYDIRKIIQTEYNSGIKDFEEIVNIYL